MSLLRAFKSMVGFGKPTGQHLAEVRKSATANYTARKDAAWNSYQRVLASASGDLHDAEEWIAKEADAEFSAIKAALAHVGERLEGLVGYDVLHPQQEAEASDLHAKIKASV